MKHLILLRHAHSGEKMPGQTDKNRQLSSSGVNQAIAAGNFLKEKNISIDTIISSTADRARETAELVAERLLFNSDSIVLDDDIYQASLGTLLRIIKAADNHQTMLIVGHNPTLSYFTEFISGSTDGQMGPGDLMILRTDAATWKDLEQGKAELLEHFIPGGH